jgi:phage shock protein A
VTEIESDRTTLQQELEAARHKGMDLAGENAKFRTRIAELEAENARLRARLAAIHGQD